MDILQQLKAFDPVLVGTVPIGIQVKGSDLDIICSVQDFDAFEECVEKLFSKYNLFACHRKIVGGLERVVVSFEYGGWPFELFCQRVPTPMQNGYRHMVIEARMLRLYGEAFREQVVKLKAAGVKTEPAFAQLLNLEGDPYLRLLELYDHTEEQLAALWQLT
jgi:hypothetical protein